MNGLRDAANNPLRHVYRRNVVGAPEQNREFVAVETRAGVFRPDATQNAVGNCGQQLVAGAMPEHVVHVLEVIQIHEKHSYVGCLSSQQG